MPFERLTKTTVQNLDFVSSGQLLVRDTQLRGFGVRVTKQVQDLFCGRPGSQADCASDDRAN
jgi:hypothetical protein